ncbi:uncharacterized protein BX663DRAFT_522194 [Cokeromyces recurvatus]|uniref:uncharacterized protein n=1 Tax=Cokeromyces recurvatus TaxID=90255 RepID=UPI00221F0C7D|nr:uncharacterized protein BX663DRAFT_522194 [Cokeromyces recurvatus]KAI7899068.1 hypothetical protein BX663DRAFT_522194 [Cokeromyces recurvatus]
MSGYPTIRNPLLPSPPARPKRREFMKLKLFSNLTISTAATLTSSISTASIRGLMSQTMHQISSAGSTLRLNSGKRIMPLVADDDKPIMPKSITENNISIRRLMSISDIRQPSLNEEKEPIVYYNGVCNTLEQLPKEKLDWIKNDDDTRFSLENPLTNYDESIVLCKPCFRFQTFFDKEQKKPKGMFYLRNKVYRCDVKVNHDIFQSSYVFDETFLVDVADETTATIQVYTQNRVEEVLLGQKSIMITLNPKTKKAERINLNSDPDSSSQELNLQLLVVYGTYVSKRAQHYFITMHTHDDTFARWERFWGVLRGAYFELYDFEYKESRPPTYVILLNKLLNIYNSSQLSEEELGYDIGSNGIVLQFLKKSEDKWFLDINSAATSDWIRSFEYTKSVFEEIEGEIKSVDNADQSTTNEALNDDDNNQNVIHDSNTTLNNDKSKIEIIPNDEERIEETNYEENEEEATCIPLKFMW